jgi:hypothetical protein
VKKHHELGLDIKSQKGCIPEKVEFVIAPYLYFDYSLIEYFIMKNP